MISSIFEKLKELGYTTVPEDHYRYVDLWKQWYEGHVRNFHDYFVFNGVNKVPCQKLTTGLAKQACEEWANRIANEKLAVTLEGEREQAFFDEVCRKNHFSQMINRYQELSFALGGSACVARLGGVAIDERGRAVGRAQELYLDFVAAEGIFPLSWENGRITECAFATQISKGDSVYCYLQLHILDGAGMYAIQNHIYRMENDALTETDLTEVPGFETVPDIFLTGSDLPLFVLFRPNISNNLDLSSPLGISVYANAIDQLKAADTIFDSLHMEFMLGRKRILIKPEVLKPSDDGPHYDPNEIVFTYLPEDAGNESVIQELKATLRVNEHQIGLDMALDMLAVRCGFGTGHWKLDRDGSILHTATEVISTNSGEYRTLKKHEIVLEDALISLARIILKIGNIWFGLGLKEDVEISVDFDDSIIEDQNVNFERDLKMLEAGILAPEEFRARWLNEDAETARKAISAIRKEGEKKQDDG